MDAGQTIMPEISYISKPTMQLRWVRNWLSSTPTLQQGWETIHYEDGRPVHIESEWRDVPFVDGA